MFLALFEEQMHAVFSKMNVHARLFGFVFLYSLNINFQADIFP